MNRLKKIIIGAFVFLVPLVTSAQLSQPDPVGNLPDLTGGQGLRGAIGFIINMVLMFASLIAVLFLIIGGYQYITSGGNDEAAEKGKKTVQNALIGIVIIILSYTIILVTFRALTLLPSRNI